MGQTISIRKKKVETNHGLPVGGKISIQGCIPYISACSKCLAAEPKHRPSMKEVLEKLERFEAANERPREPRNHASHPMVHQQGQQPLHHRSPLHPRLHFI